jgi:hypothetical protein
LLSALALVGCGDDSGGGDDDDDRNDGGGRSGNGSTAGTGGAGGTGIDPLPAETAGKSCTDDDDCAPGTCATMVEGLDGMPTPAPGGYCMGPCMGPADCGMGGSCVGGGLGMMGLCYDFCMMDSDCREGYLCGPITSTCRPAPETDQLGDDVAGTACTMDGDCGDGLCLTMRNNGDEFPGGYCSGACLEDSHCGAGGTCRRTGGGAGRCYETCASDDDCTRDGYRCRDIGGMLTGCLPAPDPLPDNTTGLACTADADCADVAGACAAELPAAAGGMIATPGGYCTIQCEIDADCGAGAVCVTTRGGAWCFKTCTDAATDCRDGYVCGERGGGDMPSIVCTPFEPDEDAGI